MTIQLLATKWLSKSFTFGFDWHWRVEGTCVGRGKCPLTAYLSKVQTLHDQISLHMLRTPPMPFFAIGDDCTARGYDNTPNARGLNIDVAFDPSMRSLSLRLEFDGNDVKRMIRFVPHLERSWVSAKGSADVFDDPQCCLQFPAMDHGSAIWWELIWPESP